MRTTKWLVAAAVLVAGCDSAQRGDNEDGLDIGTPGTLADEDGESGGDDDAPPHDEPGQPSDEPEDDPGFTHQLLFNFTVVADREQFVANDLEFEMTVGPYAVYAVTGDAPELVGPVVLVDSHAEYSMLCASTEYFPAGEREHLHARLYGGRDGTQELAQLRLAPVSADKCSGPADIFNGKSGTTLEEGMTSAEQLVIGFDPVPAVGSRILLRQAGLTDTKPGHNDSHAIPEVCCDDYYECETPEG